MYLYRNFIKKCVAKYKKNSYVEECKRNFILERDIEPHQNYYKF